MRRQIGELGNVIATLQNNNVSLTKKIDEMIKMNAPTALFAPFTPFAPFAPFAPYAPLAPSAPSAPHTPPAPSTPITRYTLNIDVRNM